MAVPVARVHLKVAHAALSALLPTPPKWNMLLPTPCVTAVLPKPLANAKPGRADSHQRWDAHKAKPSHGSPCKNATSPPPKPDRADSVERWEWDAQKKATNPASSSSSSGTSSLVASTCNKISRASSSSERWDAHKKRYLPQAELHDDGESSCTGSNDDIDDMEEIVWKPRAMYAGPGFVDAATPEPRMLPVPTTFLVRVA